MQIVTIVTICMLAVANCSMAAMPTDTTAPPLSKNPTTAVLMSLALPGLGQYYNEQYWKIPLFTGTCGVTAYLFFYYNSKYNQTAGLYDKALDQGAGSDVLASLKSQREAYRDNRDLSGVVFLSAYILAAVDAYVGAHLFDFEVSDDLSVRLGPTNTSIAAMQLRLQW